jgi:hypothetical protein
MISPRTILPFIFLLLAAACSYNLSGDYPVEPLPGEPATISISFNLDTMEQPYPADDLEVIYDLELRNGELYYVECLLEDILVYDSVTASGSDTIFDYFYLTDTFAIAPEIELDSGVYSLYMNFYYSTNTNSLGDIFGLESAVWDTVFPVVYGGIKP